MIELSNFEFVSIVLIFTVFGFLAGNMVNALTKVDKKKMSEEKITVILDYKTSKDYARLYKLLNDGQNVLVRVYGKNTFYNSWKSRAGENKYYLGHSSPDFIPTFEKFELYCKFKDLEFLDFII